MTASSDPSHTGEHPIDNGKSAFGRLAVLMVTAFIDMLGLLMILPLLPFYAKTLGAGGLIVGLLVSAFSVAQLISAPYWGRFSDKFGRRPALMVGLTASAIAYVVFAYSDSLWLLFLSRIVQGAQIIPSQFVEMIPYLLTIIALAGVVGRSVAPAALGKAE